MQKKNNKKDFAVMSYEDIQKILQIRAQRVAKVSEVEEEKDLLEILTLQLATEQYGILVELVSEIHLLEHITPVPCTPEFVVGVINIRGELISVIDLKNIFNIVQKGIADAPKVVVVQVDSLKFGILVDEINEIVNLSRKEIKPPLATLSGAKQDYLLGQTKDFLAVLNLNKLKEDDTFIINDTI